MLVFGATQVLPGDAASAILGRSATPAQKEIYRKQLGLDKPLYEQYWTLGLARRAGRSRHVGRLAGAGHLVHLGARRELAACSRSWP